MELSGINLVAVALATVSGFAFGAAYYTALGRAWMDAAGLTEDDVKKRSPVPFIVSYIGLLIMACVLSWHFSSRGAEVSSGYAVHSALILWLGLVVTIMATNNIYRQARAKLTLIDSLHWLGVLVIQSLVISAF